MSILYPNRRFNNLYNGEGAASPCNFCFYGLFHLKSDISVIFHIVFPTLQGILLKLLLKSLNAVVKKIVTELYLAAIFSKLFRIYKSQACL